MAVRFKIRGKLILSFSAVMAMVLTGLGYITYRTFTDSILDHKQTIASLELSQIEFQINEALADHQRAFSQLRVIMQTSGWQTATEILSADQKINFDVLAVMTKSGELTNVYGQESLVQSFTGADISLLMNSDSNSTPILTGRHLAYAGNASSTEPDSQLVALLDPQILYRYGDSEGAVEGAYVLFSHNGELVHNSSKKTLAGANELLNRLETDLIDSNFKKSGNVYVTKDKIASLDTDLWYVIPEEHFLDSLIELKNRVITATIIILWASVWVVLIISHRISKPIRDLSDATSDMQKHDYMRPLKYSNNGDEISDLGQRFEKMRGHIEGLIFKDPLSNVYNRRFLMNVLNTEVSKSKRKEVPLCCLMMDLDHFKLVNDTYGHQVGDEVIKQTAAIIQADLRLYDICARYGGEEFVVLLPMTTTDEAEIVAERIREKVAAYVYDSDGVKFSATISIGLSVINHDVEEPGPSMINLADEALYIAKKNGRNRVVFYGDLEMSANAS